jgi:hypothetical protein
MVFRFQRDGIQDFFDLIMTGGRYYQSAGGWKWYLVVCVLSSMFLPFTFPLLCNYHPFAWTVAICIFSFLLSCTGGL